MTLILASIWSAHEFRADDIGMFLAGVIVAYVILAFIRSIF